MAGIHVFAIRDPSVEICLRGKFSSVLERDLLREYINAFFIDALLLAILRSSNTYGTLCLTENTNISILSKYGFKIVMY